MLHQSSLFQFPHKEECSIISAVSILQLKCKHVPCVEVSEEKFYNNPNKPMNNQLKYDDAMIDDVNLLQ